MPRFLRPYCQWKVDLHYFILQFEKWTAYSNSSILDIMIFWGISMHSFVPHIFYQNQFLCLSWLSLSLLSSQTGAVPVLLYESAVLHMADFNWQISLRMKITPIKIWKVPICRIVQQNMHTIDLLVILGFKLLSMMR